MIGKQIQNYKILSLLGEGGMGTVYLAEHIKLGRKVAIKSLHPQFVNSEEIRARFIHEAKVMAELEHPNIVTLYDYVETETGLFLIIELVDGKPIDDYIEQVSGPIEEITAVKLMTEILDGFQYAHEKGLVHRDIKPSNLVIAAKNKVKILDFGIAKLIGDTSSKMTKTGTQIGTVYYMSPEQVKGDDLDHRSDIYALGVTFFQMLTGSSPYKGMTKEFEVFMKIVNEDLPDPRTIYPGISDHMCAVIQKATARDVKERFQSCDEFTSALKDSRTVISNGITESVLENVKQDSNGNSEFKSVRDKPTPEPSPQAKKAATVHSAVNDKTRAAESSRVPQSVKNKQIRTFGLIAAGVLLICSVIYFSLAEKENNPSSMKNSSQLDSLEFELGQTFQGGIIFFLDKTQKHGLIVSSKDLGVFNWNDAIDKCQNLNLNGYSDWYLPSVYDWKKLFPQIELIGEYKKYWTSDDCFSDIDTFDYAWCFDYNRKLFPNELKVNSINVRAIRSF